MPSINGRRGTMHRAPTPGTFCLLRFRPSGSGPFGVVMAMGKSVKMAVTMDKAFMLVGVFVNQVYP